MKQNEKGKKAKDPLNEKGESNITSKSILDSHLKNHKEDHYNYEDTVVYKVSSGSLSVDYYTMGGLNPGLHRFVGINEGGKAQKNSELVLTPEGWTEIGKLKVGDKIFGSDGQEQFVLGVFPQGKKDIYEVEFDDGSKTSCCLDHLWETSSFQERHGKHKTTSVRSLQYIKDTLMIRICAITLLSSKLITSGGP